MPFDTRAAKLLQPGEYMLITDCPGLRLVASATRKTWTYRFQAVQTKQMKQVAIGHWPAMPVSAAMAQWHAISRAVAFDTFTSPVPPARWRHSPTAWPLQASRMAAGTTSTRAETSSGSLPIEATIGTIEEGL